jgi:integrase
MQDATFNVRIYKTSVYKGSKVTTYYVRWKVGARQCKEAYRNKAQAESFRSSLVTAARNGEAFNLTTGRPVAWRRESAGDGVTWYAFARAYVAVKWPHAAPNYRRGIAEALTDATEALIAPGGSQPSIDDLRRAMRDWAFSGAIRSNVPPPHLAVAIRWLEQNTVSLASLAGDDGPALTRRVLERISRKRDGSMAAANTANRKRMVLGNAFDYACEISVLPANPLDRVKWTKPRTLRSVDPRTVMNVSQARRFLAEVAKQGDWGKRLVAFFGCLYYAALRPEEAIGLGRAQLVELPARGWGNMRLTHSDPRSGAKWTESGRSRERQALKHRAIGDSRTVPIHPDLVALLIDHLDSFGTGPGGRLFSGPRGGIVNEATYLSVFHEARRAALTEAEIAAGLLPRPYYLRHAAVSTWLNAGVPATQVADWAGHSVDVLLRVYAKCIAGQQDEAKRRIDEATRLAADDPDADRDE